MTIKLGDRVKDRMTGFEGIVVCHSQWITGCARLTVQPTDLHDGKRRDTECFDEPQLMVVEKGAFKLNVASDPGGPRPEPRRPETPARR
jgi:hypothetical protein